MYVQVGLTRRPGGSTRDTTPALAVRRNSSRRELWSVSHDKCCTVQSQIYLVLTDLKVTQETVVLLIVFIRPLQTMASQDKKQETRHHGEDLGMAPIVLRLRTNTGLTFLRTSTGLTLLWSAQERG